MAIMRPAHYLLTLFLTALLISSAQCGALSLPSIFADHMVLQAGASVPVWGRTQPGEKVIVRLDQDEATVTSDEKGKWKLSIALPESKGPHVLVVESAGETLEFQDVLIGEVWFCSGQSNMERTVAEAKNSEEILAKADRDEIRLFHVRPHLSTEPAEDLEGEWEISSPESVKTFSSIGYLFGVDLHERLERPVGLIEADWSSRGAESFMDYQTLTADPILSPVLKGTDAVLGEHRRAVDLGTDPPRLPASRATFIHNGMIAPLMPFGLAGILWYQGESNTWRAEQYRTMLPALIRSWREGFERRSLPFLVVQLANWEADGKTFGDDMIAELRDSQMTALDLANTAVVVTADLGEGDIHPKGKGDICFRRVVAKRLADAAASVAYGEDVVHEGPRFESLSREGSSLRLRFDAGGQRLQVQGGDLTDFLIAGEDREFTTAEAKLDGNEILVSSPKVSEPVAVRYAWSANPNLVLTNEAGLPAYPFRTDHWPLTTKGQYIVKDNDPAN
ncbi:MAG: hypothetical protein KC944_00745 [Candidatus Omnitrophica bacterium]|nr:hypothetical protein [Candidatus Omnitrophota bacterium]